MKKLLASCGMLALALSFGCSKKSSDPFETLTVHTKAMMKIIIDNKNDCNKVVAELEKYRKDHEAEIAALKKQAKETEKNMSAEEKNKYAEETMARTGDIIKNSLATVMEINQKCPEQAAKISTLMNLLQ